MCYSQFSDQNLMDAILYYGENIFFDCLLPFRCIMRFAQFIRLMMMLTVPLLLLVPVTVALEQRAQQ